MKHIDSELLAGVALGDVDPLTDEQSHHLRTCPHCQTDLDELREITRIGREVEPVRGQVPGPDLLQRINAELADEPTPAPGDAAPGGNAAPVGDPWGARDATRTATPARRFRGVVLLAAAAGLVVGIGATVAYDRVSRPDERVLASTTLTPLPGQAGSGRAELVSLDGVDKLRVQVDTVIPQREFRELWLINTDGRRMVSLGVLDASGRGTYAVPAGLRDYSIVDVSLEPYDGQAVHSLSSVVRGTLA